MYECTYITDHGSPQSEVLMDVLAIPGGVTLSKDWTVLMNGGLECKNHGLPDIPEPVIFFSAAQSFDRFILLCGGWYASNSM
jgi:hypothetical protein